MEIVITLGIVLGTGVIAFIAGYFLRKKKVVDDATEVITSSENNDPKRDEVIKAAHEQIKKNEEALDNAKKLLNSISSSNTK